MDLKTPEFQWSAIAAALDVADPQWHTRGDTGLDSAVISIKRMGACAETRAERIERRYARLKELGGDYVDGQRVGRRGAMADLIREEIAAGRRQAFPGVIRNETREAARKKKQ